jgi:hypothetical protein
MPDTTQMSDADFRRYMELYQDITEQAPVQIGELRPKTSSSGLGRANSSAAPVTTKLPERQTGLSIRDINRMSADQYQKAMQNPEFAKQVDALYAKKQ